MKKNILFILAIGFLLFGIEYKANADFKDLLIHQSQKSARLFYSKFCPHCVRVQNFIAEHNLATKMNMMQKEVTSKACNQRELVAALKRCKITCGMIELPVMTIDDKCFVGEKEIVGILNRNLSAKL